MASGEAADPVRADLLARRPSGRGRGLRRQRSTTTRRCRSALERNQAALRDRASRRLRGDRGMVTEANIATPPANNGFDWITALKAPQVQALVETDTLQLSLSTSETWPRSLPSATRASAWSSATTRTSPARGPASARRCWPATEKELAEGARPRSTTRAGALHEARTGGSANAPARVVNRYKVAKHFRLTIADGTLRLPPQRASRSAKRRPWTASTCSAPASARTPLTPQAVVRAYKLLAHAERAFRAMKGPARDPPSPPPARRARPRPRLPLHARLRRPLRAPSNGSPRCSSKTNSPLAPVDPVAPAQRSAAAKARPRASAPQDELPPSPASATSSTPSPPSAATRIRLRGSQASFDEPTEPNTAPTARLRTARAHPQPPVDRTRQADNAGSRFRSPITYPKPENFRLDESGHVGHRQTLPRSRWTSPAWRCCLTSAIASDAGSEPAWRGRLATSRFPQAPPSTRSRSD